MAQIELRNISKTYVVYQKPEGRFSALRGLLQRQTRKVEALRNLSFSVGEGELIGYIGPNGAGKSTTVKIMSGILTPDGGSCTVNGLTPWEDRRKHVANIGVVFGQRSQLWWDVPVDDSFDLLRDIYSIGQYDYRERLDELVALLELEPFLRTPTRQLSLGQRMRCEIAASLLHRPKILFLDEPTIGLDAVTKLALRNFLKEENRKHGVTMMLTTHNMADIEALCRRVMVMGSGQLLYDGGFRELKEHYSPLKCITVQLSESVPSIILPYVREIRVNDREVSIFFDPKEIPPHQMVALIAENLPITDIVIKERDLDEIIATLYQDLRL